jgi:hypothetical protein
MLTSTFSTADWWIAAAVSGVALGTALQFLAITRRQRLLMATVPVLAGYAFVFLRSAAQGDDVQASLMLCTAAMLGTTVTMAIFSRYIKRQMALVRSGKPMVRATRMQVSLFLLTFFVVTLSMAATL